MKTTERWASILQRVMSRVVVYKPPESGQDTPCWFWSGPTDGRAGYPRMSVNGVTVAVHRVMYVQFNGYLPSKRHVDHLCRQLLCVNPHHLEAVTHRENQRRKPKL